MIATNFNAPEKPRLTIHAGVTGHRTFPDADLPLLKKKISNVFSEILIAVQNVFLKSQNIYSNDKPVIRLLTPLAEGSDRIAATQALQLGLEIQCPMPLDRNEYMNDFETAESKKEFTDLLGKAASVFEIGCNADSRSDAYQNVGEIILGHSDVLIGIWDGLYTNKIGGTSDIIKKATDQNLPVVWINSAKEHEILFLYQGTVYKDWQKKLAEVLMHEFSGNFIKGSLAHLYFNETEKKRNLAIFNTLFQNLITRRSLKKISFKTEKLLQNAQSCWSELWKTNNTEPNKYKSFADIFYKPYYIWVDFLSSFYADHYRTAGIFQHLFYFISTIGYGFGLYFGFWYEKNGDDNNTVLLTRVIGFGMQAFFLFSIIWFRHRNDKRRWHQKFVDYRILAELFRQTIFLTNLGTGIHGLNIPSYNKDVNANWINWYYRAVLRQGGLPNIILNDEQLLHSRSMVVDILNEQIAYHKSSAKKNKTIDKKLEHFGNITYVVSLIMIVARVVISIIHVMINLMISDHMKYYEMLHTIEKILSILCLVLPALATVAHAIAEQGGFEKLEQRSEAMAKDLEQVKERIEEIKVSDYLQLKSIAEKTAYLMILEVTDWRVFVKSKIIKNH